MELTQFSSIEVVDVSHGVRQKANREDEKGDRRKERYTASHKPKLKSSGNGWEHANWPKGSGGQESAHTITQNVATNKNK